MKHYLITFSILILLANCTQPSSHPAKSLTGLWKLHSMEIKDLKTGRWKEWKPGTQGYLLYDAQNHVSLHLTTNHYNCFDIHFPNFLDSLPMKALKHLTNNYNYMGMYQLSDSVVRHIKLSHSNPNEWGDTSYRKVHFESDTLIMTPIEQRNARLKLKWIPYSQKKVK